MSKIVDELRSDMFTAAKVGDPVIKGIAQLAMAALKNEEIRVGQELNELEEIEIIRREVKKMKEANIELEKGGYKEMIDENNTQIAYLEKFLPKQMDQSEIDSIVNKIGKELGIASGAEMGRLMGAVMQQLKGKADGAMAKQSVDAFISKL